MKYILTGSLSFLLFLFYDINSVLKKSSFPRKFFAIGFAILVWSTFCLIRNAAGSFGLTSPAVIFAALSGLSLFLMIYALFFELPFNETYAAQNGPGEVYDKGLYALCRHPGVLFFGLFYFFLFMAFKDKHLLWGFLLFTLWNFIYIVFQDIWTFPRTFSDYEQYRMYTPFLFPTGASIQKCIETWGGKNG